jgi:hypothetical protein
MSTFVSKNVRSPFIGFQPVEPETGRQRPAQAANPLDGLFQTLIAGNSECVFACDGDFDPVALFEIQGLCEPVRRSVVYGQPSPYIEPATQIADAGYGTAFQVPLE